MHWRWPAGIVMGLALSTLLPPPSMATPAGTGLLTGTQRLRVKGCGKDTQPFTLTLGLTALGDWSAIEGPRSYAGTYTPNRKGNRADLFFDGASETLFVDQMESWASLLCEGSVVATTATRKKGRLKVNARKGIATLSVKYKLTGSGPGGPGKATYRFKVRGPWSMTNSAGVGF